MGVMNATGHVVVAAATGTDALWDLLDDLSLRSGVDGGVTVHSMGASGPRYCVHPDSRQDIEFRADALEEALTAAAFWKAQQMPEAEMWRRP